jgi:hypothetical protein
MQKGLLGTTSLDGFMKFYDLNRLNDKGQPLPIYERLTKGGKLYCGSFSEDNGLLFASGSSAGEIVMIDGNYVPALSKHYGLRVAEEEPEEMMQQEDN